MTKYKIGDVIVVEENESYLPGTKSYTKGEYVIKNIRRGLATPNSPDLYYVIVRNRKGSKYEWSLRCSYLETVSHLKP